jgi:hypothetical protein
LIHSLGDRVGLVLERIIGWANLSWHDVDGALLDHVSQLVRQQTTAAGCLRTVLSSPKHDVATNRVRHGVHAVGRFGRPLI